jgi:hypothetical protein
MGSGTTESQVWSALLAAPMGMQRARTVRKLTGKKACPIHLFEPPLVSWMSSSLKDGLLSPCETVRFWPIAALATGSNRPILLKK